MFHKIKNVSPLPDFKLSVQFCEGVTKLYDIKPLFEKLPVFASLRMILPSLAVFPSMWVATASSGGMN